MTAKVWTKPRRFMVRGACHNVAMGGWYWIWWRNRSGWNAHVFRDLPLDRADETFAGVCTDLELQAAGLRSVCSVFGIADVGECIVAMHSLMGRHWRQEFAERVREELSTNGKENG